jgi:hypothetical protein
MRNRLDKPFFRQNFECGNRNLAGNAKMRDKVTYRRQPVTFAVNA